MTGGLSLQVSMTDPTPPYEQLRRQLADLIATGSLAHGVRLPPLRQLAADLGLAVGTVARTYRELETAGLVTSRRGGGTRVSRDVVRLTEVERARALRELTTAYARQASLLGTAAQVRTAVELAMRTRADSLSP